MRSAGPGVGGVGGGVGGVGGGVGGVGGVGGGGVGGVGGGGVGFASVISTFVTRTIFLPLSVASTTVGLILKFFVRSPAATAFFAVYSDAVTVSPILSESSTGMPSVTVGAIT